MKTQAGNLFKAFFANLLTDEPEDTIVDSSKCTEISLTKHKERKFQYFFSNKLVNVFLIENNQLDIEFFEESDNPVRIMITDQSGNSVYTMNIFTDPKLHIIVDTENWDPGAYTIDIREIRSSYAKGYFMVS